jgi:hypothetical protein
MAKYLLQTLYLKAKWVRDPNVAPGEFNMKKLSDDCLIEVIKDDETNTSEIKIIERPTIEFYTVVDHLNCKPYNEMYINKGALETHVVEYSKRELEICKYLGIENEYKTLKNNMNKHYMNWEDARNARNAFKTFMNEKVYKSPFIYGATIAIEEFYKTKFMLENGNTPPKKLNISFYDIETYIYHFKNKVDQNNPEAPINIITYYNNKYNHFYCLVLEIDEIPQIQEVKQNLQQYISEYIAEDFADMPDTQLFFEFYDSEVMLMRRFMNLIRRDKPDFALAWNDNYDKKYIMGRMKKYNLNLSEEWCHPDIPEQYRQFQFLEDPQRSEKPTFGGGGGDDNKKDHSRLWDKTLCPGYTLFVDQMSLFSNLRKRSLERSYKLDAIAEKIVHANKVDLHEFGLTIRNAPFKDFKRFLKYSCRDTKLLAMIENKDNDLINYLMLTDNSDFWNGVNVSIIIKNAYYMHFLKNGYQIGNTIDYGVKESIDGALVQEPSLVDVPPLKINGKRTKIFKNVVDFDAKSLYPSLMNQGKIGKENQKYRILNIVDENDVYKMSGQEFNQYLQTKDVAIIDMCNQLYGLPNIQDILGDFEEMLMDKTTKELVNV